MGTAFERTRTSPPLLGISPIAVTAGPHCGSSMWALNILGWFHSRSPRAITQLTPLLTLSKLNPVIDISSSSLEMVVFTSSGQQKFRLSQVFNNSIAISGSGRHGRNDMYVDQKGVLRCASDLLYLLSADARLCTIEVPHARTWTLVIYWNESEGRVCPTQPTLPESVRHYMLFILRTPSLLVIQKALLPPSDILFLGPWTLQKKVFHRPQYADLETGYHEHVSFGRKISNILSAYFMKAYGSLRRLLGVEMADEIFRKRDRAREFSRSVRCEIT